MTCSACPNCQHLALYRDEIERCKNEIHKLRQEAHLIDSSPTRGVITDVDTFVPLSQLSTSYPLEISLEDLRALSEGKTFTTSAWKYAVLALEESLQQLVRRKIQDGEQLLGPAVQESLVFRCKLSLSLWNSASLEEAARVMARVWSGPSFKNEWQAILKNLRAGNYHAVVTRSVIFGTPAAAAAAAAGGMMSSGTPAAAASESKVTMVLTWPVIIRDPDGTRHWGMVQQVVALEDGSMLWQNSASMAMFGCHGSLHAAARENTTLASFDFVEMLFHSAQEQLQVMRTQVNQGGIFRHQLEITHQYLRSLMLLSDQSEEIHHDVQICLSKDPVTLQQVYTIAQIDVTAAVLAQKQVQRANGLLVMEKQRSLAVVQRQYELIECIGWLSEVGLSAAGDRRVSDLIDTVRKQLLEESTSSQGGDAEGAGLGPGGEGIRLMEMIGSGTTGKVYKGLWYGKQVAVKSIVLPLGMDGKEKRERMAIMEVAISSSLQHPNIVQTYTYSLIPIRDYSSSILAHGAIIQATSEPLPKLGDAAAASGRGNKPVLESISSFTSRRSVAGAVRSTVSAFEIQLVLELCDRGSLRDALHKGAFRLPDRAVNYLAVLDTAADIARGMAHLHSSNILHSDLKALNVLLQSSSEDPRGVTAKIADFGLSVKMNQLETHVSNMFHGTLSHMAPEILMDGQQSNAADVYAFGITLWELYTGKQVYKGIPYAVLGFQVSRSNYRPTFPAGTPPAFASLASICWHEQPASRPSFASILEELKELRGAVERSTPALQLHLIPSSESSNPEFQEQHGPPES
ncbi:hypothetical protein CEUSTIGMA_g5759.t1 [Chlamydomonas eustigma]|uniref:Protein kinase domain-containing protein n=1 Tax=Chlamydomonas eustigma TaxID=1157962 RepID=A0A250X5E4_9CHLO|nr:hypothetical protein CEUSTIGMA_g5759.t1 [Chlamydomonas eustigma]|eukprot:GAX78317.1 hypothetical protein CEUSTIGMA_g5759.t1 [Chlamydomonas eustigma]